ncbi:ATP-binding cassette domain-containing protein [Herbiconiux sp. P17]|uniref:ATP-binding cassette domain-containing protein n=1 Tax=Herbiconiux wuyangfengii TaxID=3342794 RepID=UPI0035B8E3A5
MSTDPVIEVAGLAKSYGSHAVLRGVDFAVAPGEIFALLGPNGAGKTTTVNILTTLVPADRGTATIGGIDVAKHPERVRRVISLTGQYASVDEFQTGRENLLMMSRLAHLGSRAARRRTDELLGQFDLTDAAGRRAGTYSGGMRRRLDLAISLIARPPVVFLDEPTTGLDPRSRAQMWEVVRALAAAGTTILLTTQYLEEADQLADHVAVLDDGRIIASGTADELKSRVSGGRVEVVFASPDDARAAIAAGLGAAAADSDGFGIAIASDSPVRTIREALDGASTHGLDVADITIVKPSLDDVFLALTGHVHTDSHTDNRTGNRTDQKNEVAA